MNLDTLKMRARYVLAGCIVVAIIALALKSPALVYVTGLVALLASVAWVAAAVADAAVNTKKEN